MKKSPDSSPRLPFYSAITPKDIVPLTDLSREHFIPANQPTPDGEKIFQQPVLAETNNFFVIAGLGSFTPGYVIVVSKTPQFAFANLPDERMQEAKWLMDATRTIVQQHYQCGAAVVEHDMVVADALRCSSACSNIPHMHILPIPNHRDPQKSILKHNDRARRIQEIKHFACGKNSGEATEGWRRMDFTVEDAINLTFTDVMDTARFSSITLQGLKRQFSGYDFNAAKGLMQSQVPYVLFHSYPSPNAAMDAAQSFVLPYNLWKGDCADLPAGLERFDDAAKAEMTQLGSQFGRKVVATLWGIRDDQNTELWNWRHKENYGLINMHQTMVDIAPKLQELSHAPEAVQYGFKNYLTREWQEHAASQSLINEI